MITELDAKKFAHDYLEFKNIELSLPARIKNAPEYSSYNVFLEYNNIKKLYRKNKTADDALISYWLSTSRKEAESIYKSNNIPDFSLTKDDLLELSHLSVDTTKLKEIDSILLKKGVILVYKESIESLKLDGATFLFADKIPVIAMSLRYSRLDYYWFTLMHELSHLILHFDNLKDNSIIDNLDDESKSEIEEEANSLASNVMINRAYWRNCPLKYSETDSNLLEFAKKININPAIVAGRYMKETNNYRIFSNIVNKVNVREVLL